MKVGDLVKHKGTGAVYVVAQVPTLRARSMIGLWIDNELRWMHKNWIEIISYAKRKR